ALAEADHVEVNGGSDNVFGPSQEHGAGGFRIQDGSGPEENAVAQDLPDLAEHVQGVRHGHGDFHHTDAPFDQGAHHFGQLAAVGGAHDGNDAAVEDLAQVSFLAHDES